MGGRMVDSGFDKDDFDSTMARFASKGQKIVHDISKLKRKMPEPVVLSSATHECGIKVVESVASLLRSSTEDNDTCDELNTDGWQNGTQGYGYYRSGIKD